MPVTIKLLKVATPDAAATLVVPERVPDPVRVARMLTEDEVTVLPLASTMRTTGEVASTEPDAPPTGWVVIAAVVATPVLATTATELAPVAIVADLTVTVSVLCAAKTKLVMVTTVAEVRVKTPWAIAAEIGRAHV